jgi:hypothetical protein
MKQLLPVGVGGAISSVARYQVAIAIIRITGLVSPFNTLFVNVFGSFIMDVVIEALVKIQPPPMYATLVPASRNRNPCPQGRWRRSSSGRRCTPRALPRQTGSAYLEDGTR